MLIFKPSENRLAFLAIAFSLLFVLTSAPAIWQGDIPRMVLVSSVVLGISLAAMSAIDVHSFRLPDVLTLPLIGGGLLLAWLMDWGPLWWRAASAAAGFLLLYAVERIYHRLRGCNGLGRGDAKLFAASGAWLGAEGLATVLLWASWIALLGVLLAACLGKPLTRTTRIPFGPFLAFGTWLAWFYGPLS
jgi:leader peptidase (prepilin peptidase) / N-methyltransferase